MTQSEFSDEKIRDMNKKQFRKNFPSGWMEVSRYETLVLIIDALLESPTSREFTPKELSDEAGPSDKSIEDHLDKLVELGVVQKLEDRDPVRYSLNERSPITQKLYELNVTVERVKEGNLPESLTSSPQRKIVNEHGNRWENEAINGSSKFRTPNLAASQ
jgi:DNA-binding transcriptional ArsR family regulator